MTIRDRIRKVLDKPWSAIDFYKLEEVTDEIFELYNTITAEDGNWDQEVDIKWMQSTRADEPTMIECKECGSIWLSDEKSKCPECEGQLQFGTCVSNCPDCGWQGDEAGNAPPSEDEPCPVCKGSGFEPYGDIGKVIPCHKCGPKIHDLIKGIKENEPVCPDCGTGLCDAGECRVFGYTKECVNCGYRE